MADDSGKHIRISVLDHGANNKHVKFVDVFAGGFWTAALAEDGRVFACGLNNFAQLGLPLPLAEENNGAQSSAEEDHLNYRVDRLTHVKAFDKHSRWTHASGVQHLVLRNSAGMFLIFFKHTSCIAVCRRTMGHRQKHRQQFGPRHVDRQQ